MAWRLSCIVTLLCVASFTQAQVSFSADYTYTFNGRAGSNGSGGVALSAGGVIDETRYELQPGESFSPETLITVSYEGLFTFSGSNPLANPPVFFFADFYLELNLVGPEIQGGVPLPPPQQQIVLLTLDTPGPFEAQFKQYRLGDVLTEFPIEQLQSISVSAYVLGTGNGTRGLAGATVSGEFRINGGVVSNCSFVDGLPDIEVIDAMPDEEVGAIIKGDGIPDACELIGGVDLTGDGDADDPEDFRFHTAPDINKKDIYVELDHMAGHFPPGDSIRSVQDAFAIVRDHGEYVLHVEIDPTPMPLDTVLSWPGEFNSLKDLYFGSEDERNGPNNVGRRAAKRMFVRYAVFGRNFSTDLFGFAADASGVAEIHGDDLFVGVPSRCPVGTNACAFPPSHKQAATFMHELGHTLGLGHGGMKADGTSDDLNCKPNYISVMSYLFQFDGSPVLGRSLTYSNERLATLHTNALDEQQGLPSVLPNRTIYGPVKDRLGDGIDVSDLRIVRTLSGKGIDWNQNGRIDESPVHANVQDLSVLKGISCRPDVLDLLGVELHGHNDWANLKLNFRNAGDNFAAGAGDPLLLPVEQTMEQILAGAADRDEDGVLDPFDNCLTVPNAGQSDLDQDGVGDACQGYGDLNHDGNIDWHDSAYLIKRIGTPVFNRFDSIDLDGDGQIDESDVLELLDLCDEADCGLPDAQLCLFGLPGIDDADTDGDGLADYCDVCDLDPLNDIDRDGYCADFDICPNVFDQQFDFDGDSAGDACDDDADNDGVCDGFVTLDGICAAGPDNCPLGVNPAQQDSDLDGLGDLCDPTPGGERVPGDLNGDSSVDVQDYQLIRAGFGSCSGDERFMPDADFTEDGCVAFDDYQHWSQNYYEGEPLQPVGC